MNSKIYPVETRQIDLHVMKIVLPAILESLLSYAASLVATAMIGRLLAEDISAQAIGLRLTSLVVAFFRGIGVGTTVVSGVFYGAGESQKCRCLVEQMAIIVFGISCVCVTGILLAPHVFIGFFTQDPVLSRKAQDYLLIAVWLCPFAALSRMVTAAFNAEGDTRTPLYIAVFTNSVNALAGFLLIFGIGPFPEMGLTGAAISLVLSNVCGVAAGGFALYRKGGLYDERRRNAAFCPLPLKELKAVFTTGLPASAESMLFTFASMIISRILLSYGTEIYAGYQLASQCEEVLGAPAFGFEIAATILTAQCVGRKDHALLRKCYRRNCVLSILISIPCMGIMMCFPQFLMSLLTDKPNLQQIGAQYLICVAIAYIPQMLNMITFGTMRSMGHKILPVIGALSGLWCVRVPIAIFAAWILELDVVVIFMGIAFDQCYRYLFALTVVKKKHLLTGGDGV